MSYKLVQHFQCGNGYYNSFATPFTKLHFQPSFNEEGFEVLTAMYPVIEFEVLDEYMKRKRTEKLISMIQGQNRASYPVISQWRYSRKFDFLDEIRSSVGSTGSKTCQAKIQSARALFESTCGDLDTLDLDQQQTSIQERSGFDTRPEPHLLVVDPMWLIVFPKYSKSCMLLFYGIHSAEWCRYDMRISESKR